MALLVAGRAFSEDTSHLDGSVATEKATPDGKRDFSTNSVRIGDSWIQFNGPVDDVRICSRAQSDAEIERSYRVMPASASQEARSAETVSLNAERVEEIKRTLLPLPKELEIKKAMLVGRRVKIYLPRQAHPLVRETASELVDAFTLKGNIGADIHPFEPTVELDGFSIVIDVPGLLDGKTALPKNEQGYVIQPLANGQGMLLKGTTPIGTRYAGTTLVQLIQGPAGRTLVPLARIRDWPDLEERGFRDAPWHLMGADLEYWKKIIDWHAARKLNVFTIYAYISGGRRNTDRTRSPAHGFYYQTKLFPPGHDAVSDCVMARQDFLPELVRYGRQKGIKMVVTSNCYDWWWGTVDVAYPEMQGLGVKPGDSNRWPCIAKKQTRQFLKSLYIELIDHIKPDRIQQRLSENPGCYCRCEFCRESHWLKEARMTWEVFQEVAQERAGVELEIELTQGSHPENYEIITSLPKTVQIMYYNGLRSYDILNDDNKIYPDICKAIEQGHRLTVYPCVNAYGYGAWPLPLVEHWRRAAREFVTKGLVGTSGRAPGGFSVTDYNFNQAAVAEFTWNSTGRSAEECFVAWAATEGYQCATKLGKAYALADQVARYVFRAAGRFHPRGPWAKAFRELPKQEPIWTEKDHQSLLELFALVDSLPEKRAALADATKLAHRAGYDSVVCECRIYELSIQVLEQIMKLSELRLKRLSSTDPQVAKLMDSLKATLSELRANYTLLRLHKPLPPSDGRRGFRGGVGFLDLEFSHR